MNKSLKSSLALVALIVLVTAGIVDAKLYKIPRPQQTLGGDSLGTAVETTLVAGRDIPHNLQGFACFADDSVTLQWQVSYLDSTVFVNYGALDTVAAETLDTLSAVSPLVLWPTYKYRVIINDLEGGAVKYFLLYERR